MQINTPLHTSLVTLLMWYHISTAADSISEQDVAVPPSPIGCLIWMIQAAYIT
jgi:hypothetical protein